MSAPATFGARVRLHGEVPFRRHDHCCGQPMHRTDHACRTHLKLRCSGCGRSTQRAIGPGGVSR